MSDVAVAMRVVLPGTDTNTHTHTQTHTHTHTLIPSLKDLRPLHCGFYFMPRRLCQAGFDKEALPQSWGWPKGAQGKGGSTKYDFPKVLNKYIGSLWPLELVSRGHRHCKMTGSTSPSFCSAELPGMLNLMAIGGQTTLSYNHGQSHFVEPLLS